MTKPWSREEFENQLREKGKGYHIYHPFHVLMYEGKLTKEQLQRWVANRFYYQIGIPQKDAAILSNCPDKEIRKEWIVRIIDHDGDGQAEGGYRGLDSIRQSCWFIQRRCYFSKNGFSRCPLCGGCLH